MSILLHFNIKTLGAADGELDLTDFCFDWGRKPAYAAYDQPELLDDMLETFADTLAGFCGRFAKL